MKLSVFHFLKSDPRGRNGSTPLHLACARDSSSVGRYPICQFPSLDAIRVLVECGADPNAKDADNNTALHIAATGSAVNSKYVLVGSFSSFSRLSVSQNPFTNLARIVPICERTECSLCHRNCIFSRPSSPKPLVVQALLGAGAHLDAVNANGKTFGQLLKGQVLHEVRRLLSLFHDWLRVFSAFPMLSRL